MNIQTLKGFRDFLPEQAKKRQFVIRTLTQVFTSYGFVPLETPALEYEEILSGKYGEEGDKLMYRFLDNGGRKVAMRYDQTVPLARVVAQYQNSLPFPFKRYQVQPVWRADNTQKGRFREFLQCDIDTVGTSAATADAEIIAVVYQSFQSLGFKNFRILINDRAIFGDLPSKAIQIIDKLEKKGEDTVTAELKEAGFDPEILKQLRNEKPTANLQAIMKYAEEMGVNTENLSFSPTLARGLDYYTGLILEVVIEGYSVGSVAGGGRYDGLIGMFAGKQIPAVGLAFGFDRVMEAMEEQNLFPDTRNGEIQALVTIFSPDLADDSMQLAKMLRNKGIYTELWLDPTIKMEKQLKYADLKKIPYVIILGPEEKTKNMLMLKNMKTREQSVLTREEVYAQLGGSQ
ncbi:MAG: hypothetical protein RLZZ455_794 [Candidatus Parcubacteria bacterium]|jgi:histidyl-tRNA synthetase